MNLPNTDANGYLPAYAWPGGYPIIYFDRDTSVMCPDCATKSLNDPNELLRFKPIACDVFYEGEPVHCEQCSKQIDSAYGNPE